MAESLRDTLERTAFRASLTPEYLDGHAPANQGRDGQVTAEQPTYHDLPPVKAPGWQWPIPAYFYVGGLGCGAYIVAALADMRGRRADRALVGSGFALSLVALLLSPVLLILDLGRPQRWYTMLRVYRPRSMMNQGAFALVVMGLFSGLASGVHLLGWLLPAGARPWLAPARALTWLGIAPAVVVGSYTALLLTATNIAVWAGNRLFLGPLFFASALSTGLAATKLVSKLRGQLDQQTELRLARAETVTIASELALTAASGLALRGLARPLVTGRLGASFLGGGVGVGMVAPLLLHLLCKRSPVARVAALALTLVGGAVLRLTVHAAGARSADDPHATFAFTKEPR